MFNASNLNNFREISSNLLDSYYPEVDLHSSESWDSIQVKVYFSLYIILILSIIYYSAKSVSVLMLKITTQHDNSELAGKSISSSTS